jgi:hypothetical protein
MIAMSSRRCRKVELWHFPGKQKQRCDSVPLGKVALASCQSSVLTSVSFAKPGKARTTFVLARTHPNGS